MSARPAVPAGSAAAPPVPRRSRTLVLLTVILIAVGLALGALTLAQDIPDEAHRPQDNAITAHLVIGAGVMLTALMVTAVRRSPRWLGALWSRHGADRIRLTFRTARSSPAGVLRCAAFILLAAFIGYLVVRIAMQVTAGLDPGFTRNAWGGPSAIGAFLAHGVDAVLAIGVAGWAAHLVLRDQEPLPRTLRS